MLILPRSVGERIRIGDDITITVVRIRGDRVEIGIDAPRETPVFKAENLPVHGGSPEPRED